MMFQEMHNRVGATSKPPRPRWGSPAGSTGRPLPVVMCSAGVSPSTATQKNGKVSRRIRDHGTRDIVAEEARHISFAHEYLRKGCRA